MLFHRSGRSEVDEIMIQFKHGFNVFLNVKLCLSKRAHSCFCKLLIMISGYNSISLYLPNASKIQLSERV